MSLIRRTIAACSFFPFSSRKRSRVGEWSKWSSMEFFPFPVTMMMCSIPETTHSSTTYWICGLSTTVSISLGCAFVAGKKRVPSPAAGRTALRTLRAVAPFVCVKSAIGFLADLLLLCGFLVFPFLRRRFLWGRFLRPGVFLFARGFFRFRGGLVGFVSVGAGFLSAVIRHVPTRTFELNRRRRNYRFDFATAVGALFQVRSGNILNFFRVASALQAFVLVQRH